MKVRAHSAYAKIYRRFLEQAELRTSWRGAIYRVTSLDYPRPEDILIGEGSFLHGGRWNAIGSLRAVYGSTTDTTAVVESRANAEYAGIAFPLRAPCLLVTIELALSAVIDLTELKIVQSLDLTPEELRVENWRKMQLEGRESLTQCIGRAAFAAGMNGLIVSSAKVPGGINVVYFPENHGSESKASVYEPEKLDRIQFIVTR